MLACRFVFNILFFRINFPYPLPESGAVAQLGARVNGIHEVAGSIPASSTNLRRERRLADSIGRVVRSSSYDSL